MINLGVKVIKTHRLDKEIKDTCLLIMIQEQEDKQKIFFLKEISQIEHTVLV